MTNSINITINQKEDPLMRGVSTMTGKNIIEMIKDNKLENFKMIVSAAVSYDPFPEFVSVNLNRVSDIGQSTQVAYIGGELSEPGDTDSKSLTGQEFIEMIQSNNLENYAIKVIFESGAYLGGLPVFHLISPEELGDIGHSDELFYLEGELAD